MNREEWVTEEQIKSMSFGELLGGMGKAHQWYMVINLSTLVLVVIGLIISILVPDGLFMPIAFGSFAMGVAIITLSFIAINKYEDSEE